MSKRAKIIADQITKGLDDLAKSLARGDKVSEVFTCRKVILDLRPVPYPPEMVKSTRRLLRVSQGLFAQFLGVDVSAVQKWEQGIQSPCDMACRFMDEIQRDPDYWRKRLGESIQVNSPRSWRT